MIHPLLCGVLTRGHVIIGEAREWQQGLVSQGNWQTVILWQSDMHGCRVSADSAWFWFAFAEVQASAENHSPRCLKPLQTRQPCLQVPPLTHSTSTLSKLKQLEPQQNLNVPQVLTPSYELCLGFYASHVWQVGRRFLVRVRSPSTQQRAATCIRLMLRAWFRALGYPLRGPGFQVEATLGGSCL